MIIFVRHYKTLNNIEKKIQTVVDNSIIKIPPEEINLFYYIYNKFNLKNPEVICSNSLRTQQTAKQLGFNLFSIQTEINEFNLSKYDNKNKNQIKTLIEKDSKLLDLDKKILGIEKKSNFKNRIQKFINNLDPFIDYVIFSHGLTIRNLISININNDFSLYNSLYKIPFKNLAIVKFQKDDNKLKFKEIYNA